VHTIFVQIAAYRDPELVPTVLDCIAKAKYPDSLHICIGWQHSPDENIDEIKNLPQVKIIDVLHTQTKGACWIRSKIQQRYDDETYTLQLDSHHRFLQDWDVELIDMMNLTGSKKPIITSYAGMYRPSDNQLLNIEPYKMVASNFTPGGTILFRPHSIEGWENLTSPIPARFVSGHFFFTIGEHCEEYKYDPNIYFAGDEISLSIRSYTLGYDLFHPHKTIIWHEYTREGRTKHWTDFDGNNAEKGIVEKPWWEMDNDSKRRLRHMLQEEDNGIDLGIYGLGNVRSHHDYERYAGINFLNRKLHPLTLKGVNPPINDDNAWAELVETEYNLTLDIPFTENFKFIYIGVENEKGEVIYREDLTEYKPQLNVVFKSFDKPEKWVYWPVDIDGNWYDRQDIIL